jgi:hypothetical protein
LEHVLQEAWADLLPAILHGRLAVALVQRPVAALAAMREEADRDVATVSNAADAADELLTFHVMSTISDICVQMASTTSDINVRVWERASRGGSLRVWKSNAAREGGAMDVEVVGHQQGTGSLARLIWPT